ncbi:hypothetical protein FQA39_LY17572 [Lamprigera yunnana]|nr:hypothetical protein FQA39_LY17572 [Lamprigera yunnana]
MEVEITTFRNPHLFWIFETKNVSKREEIEKELEDRTLSIVKPSKNGQFVAVFNDGKWKRARVELGIYPYRCWLLDYGVQAEVNTAYELPSHLVHKPILVKQASLIDVVCIIEFLTLHGVNRIGLNNFTCGSIRIIQECLESAKKLFFKCRNERENVHFGTVKVVNSDNEFDLTEHFIKMNVIEENKTLFESAFEINSENELQDLETMSCDPVARNLAPILEFVNLKGVGRGIVRTTKQDSQVGKRLEETSDCLKQKEDLMFENNNNSGDGKSTNTISISSDVIECNELLAKYEKEMHNIANISQPIQNSVVGIADAILEEENKTVPMWEDLEPHGSKKTHLNILPAGMYGLGQIAVKRLTKPSSNSINQNNKKSHSEINKTVAKTDEVIQVSTKTNGVIQVNTKADEVIQVNKLLDAVPNVCPKGCKCEQCNTKEDIKGNSVLDLKVPSSCLKRCKCKECNSWVRMNYLDVERENQLIDDNKCKEQKLKDVSKPYLLLKPRNRNEEQFIKSCIAIGDEPNYSVSSLLVHGRVCVLPITSLTYAPFHEDIKKALKSFSEVYTLQNYTWPAVMRYMNACIIGNRKSGKTMAYLPGICTFELSRDEHYRELPKSTISPSTVILCPGVKTAEKTFNTILKLLENTSNTVHVVLAVMPIDKCCVNQFKQKVDILVATPNSLATLLSIRTLTLKRLCSLVIEDADIVLKKFSTTMEELLNLIQSMLNHRSCNYTIQMIVVSEKWTRSIEDLLKSLARVPIVCIGSYLEAALYGRAYFDFHFLESRLKMKKLLELLRNKVEVCRTVVICNENEEIVALKQFISSDRIKSLFITDDMNGREILDIELQWLHSSAGKHFVLFCTEQIFSTFLSITNAVTLVHYSLPSTWTRFVNRFKCMLNNYISPLTTKTPELWTNCKVHIFVDECCDKKFPKLLELMTRLKVKLPTNFQTLYENTVHVKEEEKIKMKTELCTNFKLFSNCSQVHCKMRHMISKDLDYNNDLPQNGVVKFKIIRTQDVTHFTVKLLTHIGIDGKKRTFETNDDLEQTLKKAMNTLSIPENDVKLNCWYVYGSNENYKRCVVKNILSVTSVTKKAADVSIYCLDTGEVMNVACSSLYALPEEFHIIPPQVVNVRLADLVPPDSDDTWSFYSKKTVEKILHNASYKIEDVSYASGTILLKLGNELWLNNIKLCAVMDSTKLTLNKLNLRNVLLEKRLVERREILPDLYKACVNANIELPSYNIRTITAKTEVKQVLPQWAHLDETKTAEVYMVLVDSPSLLYLQLKKFHELLLRLQDEIQEVIAKPFYPSITEVFVDKCYLAKDPEDSTYARVVVREIKDELVTVFFVDYGDFTTVYKSELKYLSDEFISKLPFQCIECRLYGVQPVCNDWQLSVTDKLLELSFEPDSNYYRTFRVSSCIAETCEGTGRRKYSVILGDTLNNNVMINQLLIDSGDAVESINQNLNEKMSLFDNKDQENLETTWSMEFNDPVLFLKNLRGEKTASPKQIDSSRAKWELPPLAALPPSDYSTPNIYWYQTETNIHISIMLPNVNECSLLVLRGKLFLFRTTYDEKQYKLNLTLYDYVENNFQHTLSGPCIKVTLKKREHIQWPRLIWPIQKMRFIKYDFAKCVDVTEQEHKPILDLGWKDDEENVDDEDIEIFASDEDYSDSDFDAEIED